MLVENITPGEEQLASDRSVNVGRFKPKRPEHRAEYRPMLGDERGLVELASRRAPLLRLLLSLSGLGRTIDRSGLRGQLIRRGASVHLLDARIIRWR